jgi:hypothetical protein
MSEWGRTTGTRKRTLALVCGVTPAPAPYTNADWHMHTRARHTHTHPHSRACAHAIPSMLLTQVCDSILKMLLPIRTEGQRGMPRTEAAFPVVRERGECTCGLQVHGDINVVDGMYGAWAELI